MCSPSQNSYTSSPQQTGAYFPPPPRLHAPSDVFLVSRHLQLHLPPQVRAHAHGSSKPSVTGVFSVCFPRQQKTTDLPRARTTCCAGRHIWPYAWSSSAENTMQLPSFPNRTGMSTVEGRRALAQALS